MKSIFRFFSIAIVLMLTSGCATSLVSDVDSQVDLDALQRFYVVKLSADNRGIQHLIVNKLNSMGKTAVAGTNPNPASPVDAVVTYEDKWMWDITMYMLELRIGIRDPETNYKFASGHSYRTSLVRKSPEEMVSEVLGKIFEDRPKGE